MEYYNTCASIFGTLHVNELNFLSPAQGGVANAPGIFNDAAENVWRRVTNATHAQVSYMVCQLLVIERSENPG